MRRHRAPQPASALIGAETSFANRTRLDWLNLAAVFCKFQTTSSRPFTELGMRFCGFAFGEEVPGGNQPTPPGASVAVIQLCNGGGAPAGHPLGHFAAVTLRTMCEAIFE